MSKKHYIAIAKIIDELDEFNGSLISKCDLIMRLTDYLKSDNGNFDAGRFSEACQATNHDLLDMLTGEKI